jgi:hypothetical protein
LGGCFHYGGMCLLIVLFMCHWNSQLVDQVLIPCDTPLNSLKYSNVSPKVKTMKEKRVGVCSLICDTLKVRGACCSSGMGIRMSDKLVNYSCHTSLESSWWRLQLCLKTHFNWRFT